MDFLKPFASGPSIGFSKPRTKIFKKPRSADSLRELVLEVKPSDIVKEFGDEKLRSSHGLDMKGDEDAPETHATLAGESMSLPEEELLSVKRNQSAERQVSKNDDTMQSRGKSNHAMKASLQSGNEHSNHGRLQRKVNKDAAEPISSRDLRMGKEARNGFIGSMKENRSDRSMKELLVQDVNQEETGRVKEEMQRKKNERFEIVRKVGSSARLQRVHQGLEHGGQAGRDIQEASRSVEHMPTKLKLKAGGVTHTLQKFVPAQVLPAHKVVSGRVSEIPEASKSGIKRRRQRLILQGISDDEENDVLPVEKPMNKSTEQHCILLNSATLSTKEEGELEPSKDHAVSEHRNTSKQSKSNLSASPSDLSTRKSSRAAKRCKLDREEDDVPETRRKHRRKSKSDEEEFCDDDENGIAAMSSEREASSNADVDSLNEDEYGFYQPRKKVKLSPGYFSGKKEKVVPLTARQRALQSFKGGDTDAGASLIEFPDGLPSSSRRKQTVNLTEEEKLAKKAETARRRKQQTEKAAKDIQASAIQKILNQDSVRRKREDRLQKQREENAQNKKAAESEIASNSIRWTYGPTGIVVSWSKDVELPTLFRSGPCSYPPPREKCAIPTCNNAYKYRHSRLKLPLCSLECYRMVDAPTEVASAV